MYAIRSYYDPEASLFEIGNEYIPTLQDKLPEVV